MSNSTKKQPDSFTKLTGISSKFVTLSIIITLLPPFVIYTFILPVVGIDTHALNKEVCRAINGIPPSAAFCPREYQTPLFYLSLPWIALCFTIYIAYTFIKNRNSTKKPNLKK